MSSAAKTMVLHIMFFLLLQKQAMLVRQLEEELRIRSMQNPSHEVRQQVEAMYAENDHLSREVAILRETVKVRVLIDSELGYKSFWVCIMQNRNWS